MEWNTTHSCFPPHTAVPAPGRFIWVAKLALSPLPYWRDTQERRHPLSDYFKLRNLGSAFVGAACVVQLVAHSFHILRVASSIESRSSHFSFLLLARKIIANASEHSRSAAVHSPGKVAPLGVLCLRVGAFTPLWSFILLC